MSNYDLSYLIEKIKKTDFQTDPFRHIYIENFFSEHHFHEIVQSAEIKSPESSNDVDLIDGLYNRGFQIINFPGCVTDKKKYIEWHEKRKISSFHSACEGFGMALRLNSLSTPILKAVNDFITGDDFNQAIAHKFGISLDNCNIDGGIQKYLDGYEISPHPDIRRKAATFMVNINPASNSEEMNHHTHYMRFHPSKMYIQQFWLGNPDIERAWVPWDWAISEKQQIKNNSIVLFSPSNDTLHGVKANYNHFISQRTQLYGNLWYKEEKALEKLEWEDLDLKAANARGATGIKFDYGSIRRSVAKIIPAEFKKALKQFGNKDKIGTRNF